VNLRVVLVRPRYAGNIGAAVRVAANFSAGEVALVETSWPKDDPEFVRMAMGGEKLVATTSWPTLAAAVADRQMVVATTSARKRDAPAICTPGEARRKVEEAAPETVALVFGPERGGLTREEMCCCHVVLHVRTSPAFPVLNLAQAVAIVLAAFAPDGSLPSPPRDPLDRLAPHEELEAAITQLQATLLASGYLDPNNPGRVVRQFRRWLGRSVPTSREVALLRALAAHIDYLRGRSRPQGDG
jgi:tRNA/rRNA methyltransferase/tRNA (cytidine32/uridine32-2'-O)-methyltransferase